MCLIVFAWRQHPLYNLVLAANRDEFHARPTEPAHWWAAPDGLFGGRDQQAGGAWCAASRDGRFAAVTNVREPGAPAGRLSRGHLVRDYLAGSYHAESWAKCCHENSDDYSPFNLLVGDGQALWFVSNRGQRRLHAIPPGIFAMSNGHWGDHWPKTDRAQAGMAHVLADLTADATHRGLPASAVEALFDMLVDNAPAEPATLPATGVPIEQEMFLSPIFIQSAVYGTRASTVLLKDDAGHTVFHERGFDPAAGVAHRVSEQWCAHRTTDPNEPEKDCST